LNQCKSRNAECKYDVQRLNCPLFILHSAFPTTATGTSSAGDCDSRNAASPLSSAIIESSTGAGSINGSACATVGAAANASATSRAAD
jgi:hypothetical protein